MIPFIETPKTSDYATESIMAEIDMKKPLAGGQPHLQDYLHRGLKDRHVQMIAVGGTIGVDLFLGSATAIQKAGPGLVVSYAIGGLIMFFVMRALGELLLYKPDWQRDTQAYSRLSNSAFLLANSSSLRIPLPWRSPSFSSAVKMSLVG
jgi:amino acid permease